ncbi:MAG: ABC transporter ATP-binding protein [Desulfacinum sp.]|jgi:iron complex transport system ATP-binding protein|nr:ABC transporter ATP-binding protein [Desulfacinum sp.]MBZ4658122.1 iron transporter [Desulfacinum sp.]
MLQQTHMGASENEALKVSGVHFSYGARPVLHNVNFSVPPGTFTVVLGRNGSGKSTLFRIIVGLLRPHQGTVSVFGRPVQTLSFRERTRFLGFLPQHHHPVFPFSVEDVVLTGRAAWAGLTPKEEDRAMAVEALERLGIGHLKGKPYTELSGGEQQLVLIARVLAQSPRVLLLDEPTSHLDFVNANRLLALIRECLCPHMTVVGILHDPNLAFRHGSHFLFLSDGEMVQASEELRPWDPDLLHRVYGMSVETVPYGNRAFVIPC